MDDTPRAEPHGPSWTTSTSSRGRSGILLRGEPLRRAGRYPRDVKRKELLVDAAIATGVFALSLVLLAAGARDSETDARSFDALGVALAALGSFPLLARRRAPLAVFALTAAASIALTGLDYPPGPPLGPTVLSSFSGLETRPRLALARS